MALPDGLGDLQIRAYLASVIGAFRGPFGRRGAAQFTGVGQSAVLVTNGTRDGVLSVSVSRSDVGGPTVAVIFAQQNVGGTNDFTANFLPTSTFRFVLYPGDILSMTQVGVGTMQLVVGQETY